LVTSVSDGSWRIACTLVLLWSPFLIWVPFKACHSVNELEQYSALRHSCLQNPWGPARPSAFILFVRSVRCHNLSFALDRMPWNIFDHWLFKTVICWVGLIYWVFWGLSPTLWGECSLPRLPTVILEGLSHSCRDHSGEVQRKWWESPQSILHTFTILRWYRSDSETPIQLSRSWWFVLKGSRSQFGELPSSMCVHFNDTFWGHGSNLEVGLLRTGSGAKTLYFM
jgi:hypothetical protein